MGNGENGYYDDWNQKQMSASHKGQYIIMTSSASVWDNYFKATSIRSLWVTVGEYLLTPVAACSLHADYKSPNLGVTTTQRFVQTVGMNIH